MSEGGRTVRPKAAIARTRDLSADIFWARITAKHFGRVSLPKQIRAHGGVQKSSPALLLRLDCMLAARVAAGVGVPAEQDEGLRKTVRDLWTRAREQWQDSFWATWTRNNRGHPWNDRSRALALVGSTGRVMGGSRWGGYTQANDSPEWIGIDEPVRDEECPVCMEPFSDWLPSSDDNSRAAPDLFACQAHAMCRQCDASHQASANNRCPLCRAARARVHATDGDA